MTNSRQTKGQWVGKLPCTSSDCTSSDGLNVYRQVDGTFDAYCFVCGHYDNDPYQDGTGRGREILVEPDRVVGNTVDVSTTDPYFQNIVHLPCKEEPSRGLTQATMEYFNIRTELSQSDGTTIIAHYYPYYKDGQLVAFKKRVLPKEISTVGKFSGADLFGERQARMSGSKKLFITEGELDAASLFQALKDHSAGTQWAHINPAVVSINSGAASAPKDIGRRLDFVRSFEQVILVMDQDTAGKEAESEILKLLPDALIAVIPEKDPNDMIVKGRSRDLAKAALFNAARYKPAAVVGVEDVFDRAIAMPTYGTPWPWPTLTNLTYGIHRKKLYGLGAGVGIGKTDWSKELQSHLVNRMGLKIGACMLEEDVGRTLKGIAGKFTGKQFHKPDGSFTPEELHRGISDLKGKVFLYDHMGTKDWDDVKAAIRYMVVSEGVKDIFLDPLTALVSHLSSAEANDELNRIMGDMAGLVHELDFTIYYMCHLNPPQSGPPHERGGHVHESQFTGSRAMMKWSHYLFGLERNKDPELDEDTRNTSHMVLLKDREFGNVGKFPIYYNKYTGTYREPIEGGYG